LGRYYYVTDANGVVDPDVDLEEMAGTLGAIQSWETLKVQTIRAAWANDAVVFNHKKKRRFTEVSRRLPISSRPLI
jgi:hypothetical protein